MMYGNEKLCSPHTPARTEQLSHVFCCVHVLIAQKLRLFSSLIIIKLIYELNHSLKKVRN